MCTLTLSLQDERAIVTSNRDVHRDRPPAEEPTWYCVRGRELYFPRDPLGGGSWIAHDREGRIGVLLNGAFEAHHRAPEYRKSRGRVLLDLMSSDHPYAAMEEIDLSGIEPFTFVLLEHLPTELRWDGRNKHFKAYPGRGDFIWSSCTLFDPKKQEFRRLRFEEFLEHSDRRDPEDFWALQSESQIGGAEGYVIDRPDGNRTVNRVQWVREQDSIVHRFE